MIQDPAYTKTVSIGLSEALSDIGVNDIMVMKRRRTYLLEEALDNSFNLIVHGSTKSVYHFGSQSEGTTTPGLKSDLDILSCTFVCHVIQDLSEWKPGVTNYLMIQDNTVPHGYCLLQLLRKDVSDSETHVPDERHFRDRSGRILLRNTAFRTRTAAAVAVAASCFSGTEVAHGPAHALCIPGTTDEEFVVALQCKSWPIQARQWQGENQWPSDRMMRDFSKTGCFVVGVASKGSENQQFEWRISTSLAERYLMFSLNITQIRCYVLMKMLVKIYIKPYYEDAISSYMCKTLIFQSINNTHSNFWRESNLISCLSWCLLVLYNYVLNENCPHFIIHGNNLMTGHITHESKPKILGMLLHIIKHIKEALLQIDCDILGARLRDSFRINLINSIISGQLSYQRALSVNRITVNCLLSIGTCSNEEAIQTLLKYIVRLYSIYHQDDERSQKARMLITPWLYTTLGSVLASLSIGQKNSISANALDLISMGLNTDVSSSKLKQASMFHSIRDMHKTEHILRDIEENYDKEIVEPTCACYISNKKIHRRGFIAISDSNEEAIQHFSAFCVIYLSCEINCMPHELRYEMFRSTKVDLLFRTRLDRWMDLVVVDSLPYLYFLQYKTYSHLERQDDKQRAISNLLKTIKEEPNLGHRETALNLLGQCMEGEDRVNDAFNCYVVSFSLRKRHNAAKVHICRLLSKLIKNQLENNHSKKVSLCGDYGDVVH